MSTLRPSKLLGLLALSFLFNHVLCSINHGVGFHLSLDYGVASVYFSNGSTVDIAKIEGGSSYKQMMRAAYLPEDGYTSHRMEFNNDVDFGLEAMQNSLKFQSLRNYLPPWFGGRDPRSQPLTPMLKALKTAAESYLERDVSDAEVVVPFPVRESYRMALRSSCSSLSLHMPMSAQPPAGILAAHAYGIGRKACDYYSEDDPPQLILTVEYSRASVTALLVHEECKVFETRRVLHDIRLGSDSLHGGSQSSRTDLKNALRNLTSLPINDGGNGDDLKFISNLVLLGESAGEVQLHSILKEILGEQYDQLIATTDQSHTAAIPVLFAASRGVAYDCWDRLNFSG